MITEKRKDELQTEIMQILDEECNIDECKEILREMLDYMDSAGYSLLKRLRRTHEGKKITQEPKGK